MKRSLIFLVILFSFLFTACGQQSSTAPQTEVAVAATNTAEALPIPSSTNIPVVETANTPAEEPVVSATGNEFDLNNLPGLAFEMRPQGEYFERMKKAFLKDDPNSLNIPTCELIPARTYPFGQGVRLRCTVQDGSIKANALSRDVDGFVVMSFLVNFKDAPESSLLNLRVIPSEMNSGLFGMKRYSDEVYSQSWDKEVVIEFVGSWIMMIDPPYDQPVADNATNMYTSLSFADAWGVRGSDWEYLEKYHLPTANLDISVFPLTFLGTVEESEVPFGPTSSELPKTSEDKIDLNSVVNKIPMYPDDQKQYFENAKIQISQNIDKEDIPYCSFLKENYWSVGRGVLLSCESVGTLSPNLVSKDLLTGRTIMSFLVRLQGRDERRLLNLVVYPEDIQNIFTTWAKPMPTLPYDLSWGINVKKIQIDFLGAIYPLGSVYADGSIESEDEMVMHQWTAPNMYNYLGALDSKEINPQTWDNMIYSGGNIPSLDQIPFPVVEIVIQQ